MDLTKEQMEQVFKLAAHCTGQCLTNPHDELETIIESWSKDAKEGARSLLDDQLFYCEGCGWYVDADERHDGDLCDDCHDEQEEHENGDGQ